MALASWVFGDDFAERGSKAIRTLTEPRLRSDAEEAAIQTLKGLAQQDPNRLFEMLKPQFQENNTYPQVNLLRAIGKLGPAVKPAAKPLLLGILESRPDLRVSAALAVDRLQITDRDVQIPIEKLLNDRSQDRMDRGAAAFVLGEMRAAAAPAVPSLTRAADEPDPAVRRASLAALGRIGPGASSAVPTLLRWLKQGDASDRAGAAYALGYIGAKDASSIDQLSAALSDSSPDVQAAAAMSLGRIATPLSPDVTKALRGLMADKKTGLSASFALAKLGEPDGFARLGELAKAPTAQGEVFRTIQELGPSGVPILREVIHNECVGTRWAIESLGAIGPASAPAVPDLVTVLKSGRAGNRRFRFDAAVAALQSIGPSAREALPVLKESIERATDTDARSGLNDAISAIEASPTSQDAQK
jgi:HEAT repeat protein